MMPFQPSLYFDLASYSHQSLFDGVHYVWEALEKLEEYLANYQYTSVDPQRFPGVHFVHPEKISLGENVIIEPGSYIQGPCVLGKGTVVRHGAYLRKNVIAGEDCVIGHSTELKNVILFNAVHIAHLAYGGDSIYGHGCNIGAGVKNANLKFCGPIVIRTEEMKIQVKLRKLGAIIGDGAQLGCNSVTNPGTLLGRNCFLYPCVNFGGVAPAHSSISFAAKPKVLLRKERA